MVILLEMKPKLCKSKKINCTQNTKAKNTLNALALSEPGSDKDLTNSVDELDIAALLNKH